MDITMSSAKPTGEGSDLVGDSSGQFTSRAYFSSQYGNYADTFGVDTTFSLVGVSAAPEPASWALMLLGVGGVGAALRTRRRKAVAA